MKLDLLHGIWSLARNLAYFWAVIHEEEVFHSALYIRNTDFSEEDRFIPDGKAIRVTIEFINEEEAE